MSQKYQVKCSTCTWERPWWDERPIEKVCPKCGSTIVFGNTEDPTESRKLRTVQNNIELIKSAAEYFQHRGHCSQTTINTEDFEWLCSVAGYKDSAIPISELARIKQLEDETFEQRNEILRLTNSLYDAVKLKLAAQNKLEQLARVFKSLD